MPRSAKPLPSASLHIVLALLEGELHGYALMGRIAELSDGVVRMGPGTLYGTLQRLMEQGLVEEAAGPARAVDERRRYYQLSRAGRAALKVEVERMETLVRTARARRVSPRPSRG